MPHEQPKQDRRGSKHPQHRRRCSDPEYLAAVADACKRAQRNVDAVRDQEKTGKKAATCRSTTRRRGSSLTMTTGKHIRSQAPATRRSWDTDSPPRRSAKSQADVAPLGVQYRQSWQRRPHGLVRERPSSRTSTRPQRKRQIRADGIVVSGNRYIDPFPDSLPEPSGKCWRVTDEHLMVRKTVTQRI